MKIRLLCFALLLAAGACANPEMPPGGPADKEAPAILQVAPASGTTLFDGRTINIEFNEWVRGESLTENVFVSPPTEFEVNWSGPEVEIEFTEELAANTTYAVTIGAEVSDYRGNKGDRSTTIIFATGAVLDSGSIRGRVFDATSAGAFVYLYPLNGLDRDTLDPRHTQPRYLTQLGKTGDFEFQALAPGAYRILVVDDEFRDRLFEPGVDGWGAAADDITLKTGEQRSGLPLRMRPAEDLRAPQLYEVRPLAENKFAAVFNEKPDPATISPESFALSDSTGTTAVAIATAHVDANNPMAVILRSERALDVGRRWLLDAPAVRDSSGNLIADTASSAIFSAAARPDSSAPQLVGWPFTPDAKGVSRSGPFDLVFSEAMALPAIEGSNPAIRLINSLDSAAGNIGIELAQPSANVIRITPAAELQPGVLYHLNLDGARLQARNGRSAADSLIQRSFITADPRDEGDAMGTLINSADYDGAFIIQLRPVSGDSEKLNRSLTLDRVDGKGEWQFSGLLPAQYDIIVIQDKNGNGRYDFGRVFPFEPAEEFRIFPSILRVKPRWTTQDINLTF